MPSFPHTQIRVYPPSTRYVGKDCKLRCGTRTHDHDRICAICRWTLGRALRIQVVKASYPKIR